VRARVGERVGGVYKGAPKSWWPLDLSDRKPVEPVLKPAGPVLKPAEPVSARGFFGSVTGSAGGWTGVKTG
jgi:hypothetical protein